MEYCVENIEVDIRVDLFTAKGGHVKVRQNIQISFCKMLKNK